MGITAAMDAFFCQISGLPSPSPNMPVEIGIHATGGLDFELPGGAGDREFGLLGAAGELDFGPFDADGVLDFDFMDAAAEAQTLGFGSGP